jgi:predicted PurR-regulated permease PerM
MDLPHAAGHNPPQMDRSAISHSQREDRRLERTISGLALLLLVVGCLIVIFPFISALLWAVVLSFTTWSLYERMLAALKGRKTWAALLMTLSITLVLLVPFAVVGYTLADNLNDLSQAWHQWMQPGPPDAPLLRKIPLIGNTVANYWLNIKSDQAAFLAKLKDWLQQYSPQLLNFGLALGRGLVELAVSIFITFFLFRDGLGVAVRSRSIAQRIAGDRGEQLLLLAGKTVRSVVLGILGTALVQGLVAGFGFLIAGVPAAPLLALLTFFLSVLPIGPPLIWIPATIYLFTKGSIGWGIFMGAWGLVVSSVDNVVKPWLISQGSDMPFILIFFGVIGGALAFGLIGVFLGPTLLAVGFRLLKEWAHVPDDDSAPAAPVVPPPPAT